MKGALGSKWVWPNVIVFSYAFGRFWGDVIVSPKLFKGLQWDGGIEMP